MIHQSPDPRQSLPVRTLESELQTDYRGITPKEARCSFLLWFKTVNLVNPWGSGERALMPIVRRTRGVVNYFLVRLSRPNRMHYHEIIIANLTGDHYRTDL